MIQIACVPDLNLSPNDSDEDIGSYSKTEEIHVDASNEEQYDDQLIKEWNNVLKQTYTSIYNFQIDESKQHTELDPNHYLINPIIPEEGGKKSKFRKPANEAQFINEAFQKLFKQTPKCDVPERKTSSLNLFECNATINIKDQMYSEHGCGENKQLAQRAAKKNLFIKLYKLNLIPECYVQQGREWFPNLLVPPKPGEVQERSKRDRYRRRRDSRSAPQTSYPPRSEIYDHPYKNPPTSTTYSYSPMNLPQMGYHPYMNPHHEKHLSQTQTHHHQMHHHFGTPYHPYQRNDRL